MMPPLDLPHVRFLCAAIDAGDDTALFPLADALEECGEDRLAKGLRRGPWYLHHHVREEGAEVFCPWEEAWCYPSRSGLIAHGGVQCLIPALGGHIAYPSRSAAFLALAKAVTA